MRGFTSTVASALVAVALLGACSESKPASDRVAPKTWAKSVCGALKPWTAEIQQLQGQAQQKITAKSNAAQTKTELVALFGGMEQSTSTVLTEVAKAGVPDVTDGDKIADQFVQVLTGARDSFATGREAVDKLGTADQAAFYNGVVAAGTEMSKEYGQTAEAFGEIKSPELDKALDEVPECS
jgi:ABC-type glycerol-3-phosphate transport system substrate-binding protein